MRATCHRHDRAEFGCAACILALARANATLEIESAPICTVEFEWEVKGRGQGEIQVRVPEGWTIERVLDHYVSHMFDDINSSHQLTEIVGDARLDDLKIHRPVESTVDLPKLWSGVS